MLNAVKRAVKADERPAPVHIGFVRAHAVMQETEALPQLVEQPLGPQRRQAAGTLSGAIDEPGSLASNPSRGTASLAAKPSYGPRRRN